MREAVLRILKLMRLQTVKGSLRGAKPLFLFFPPSFGKGRGIKGDGFLGGPRGRISNPSQSPFKKGRSPDKGKGTEG